MDIAILVILSYVAVVLQALYNRTRTKTAAPKAIHDAPAPSDHLLTRTWVERGDSNAPGWRWKCSCGVIGLSSGIKEATITQSGSLGAESLAIERFKAHAKGYREANGNMWKDKHDALKAEFDVFQEKCYCKETFHHQLERP
jgi:hypothetical protein